MRKKSLYFMLLKLLKFPLSILTLSLTVKQFGVSIEMDSWLIALAGITTVGLAVWGAVNETFRSRFVMLKETEGDDAALVKVRSLLFYIFIFSVFGMVVVWCYPQLLARLFATATFYHKADTLLVMFQMLAPFLLLNQCVSVCTSILNAYEVFYIPEISSAVSQVINILLILLFAERLGVYVLVIALYISTILLLLFLLYKLRRLNVNVFQFSIPNIEGFKMFFLFAIPFFIPYFLGQLNGMVEKRMATTVGVGAISILDFSKRVPDILNGVILSLVLTILVPTLTKFFVTQQKQAYQKAFMETYKLALFCLIGFVTLFIVGADDILMFLYGKGKVTDSSLQEIIRISRMYAVSLFGVFSYVIFGMTMLSINKSRTYAFWGSVAQVISILMNYLLVDYWGIVIFPITFFFAHIVSAIFMFYQYPYERKDIVVASARYYIYGVLCCFIAYQLFRWSYTLDVAMFSENLFRLVFKGGLVVVTMFVLGIIFRIEEIKKVGALAQQLVVNIVKR